MRVHKVTFAALAVAASLSLTACQNDDAGQSSPSSASTASNASSSSGSSGSGGSGRSGDEESTGTNTGGAGSDGKGTAGGTETDTSSKVGNCRTDGLKITAMDSTIDGDADGTVAVTFENRSGRDCSVSGYAGVDLKTSAGTLSAKRTGEAADRFVLKSGKSVSFGISYPINTSGGSGVRVTGLLVTPPNETKTATLAWPGGATLPVTEGGGSSVKVGPMGSAGQGG